MLRNCRHCGRVLTTPAGTPCADCLAAEDAAIERINAYLLDGGVPTMAEVAQRTALPVGLLRRLMRSGRISLRDGQSGVSCVLCGRSLEGRSGRLCRHCAAKVAIERAGEGPARHAASGQAGLAGKPLGGFYSRPSDFGRNGI